MGTHDEDVTEGWLPEGAVTVGLTVGASTPALRGRTTDELTAA